MIVGKARRLRKIFRSDGRTVIIAMDHGVSMGPIAGLVEMQETVKRILHGEVDAILVHKGIAKHVDIQDSSLIVHVSGSTSLSTKPNLKVQVCTVEEAIRLGADAVSVHINVGSEGEEHMLEMLGSLADKCDYYGLPLLAMMYPRGPNIQSEHGFDVVSHAARLGVELGADVIKTNYTGDPKSFREVVKSCSVPVVVAGGPKMKTDRELFEMVYDSLKAGSAGLSIGRNVFQHSDPAAMSKALSSIIHHNANVDQALKVLGGSS